LDLVKKLIKTIRILWFFHILLPRAAIALESAAHKRRF